MAELLIKARDATHADPDADRRGCYKRGDIVTVQPDGHEWSPLEGLPHHVLIKIPGVSADRLMRLAEEQTEDDAGNPTYQPGTAVLASGPVPRVFRRRRWRLLVDNIPAAVRNQLLTTGSITVTPAQIRNFLRRKRDDLQYDDL